MKRAQIATLLAAVVSLTGLVVMFGWVYDIPILKSILPAWVTMKFTTALCFFLSGITIYAIVILRQGRISLAQTILPITCMIITLLMASLLVSIIFGIHTGIEDLFVKEQEGALYTVVPGRPSVGTMLSFILIILSGLLAFSNKPDLIRSVPLLGRVICILGGVAIIGYIINQPLLYYTIRDASSAMALHTAILFVFSGVGLVIACSPSKK